MIRNILLDVDGTLWDSAPQVTVSWNEVLEQHRDLTDRVVTVGDMYHLMGKTMTEIGEALFPELPADTRNALMRENMEHENEYLQKVSGRFYDGLEETLLSMTEEGFRFYIVSNCQDEYIQALLQYGRYHECITDFDCYGRTGLPKCDTIRILMKRDRLKPEETVYLGDTSMDETAAGKAGIAFIHAAYGFGTAEHPLAVVHDIRELPQVIGRLNADRFQRHVPSIG